MRSIAVQRCKALVKQAQQETSYRPVNRTKYQPIVKKKERKGIERTKLNEDLEASARHRMAERFSKASRSSKIINLKAEGLSSFQRVKLF